MFNKSRIRWRLPASVFWRQNMQDSPLMEVENSIALRVLVLALVIVLIVATDTGAEIQFSL